MELRRCGLDDCTISEHFQSSVKYFQAGRYFISDRRTKGHGHPPFISDRRTKEHGHPPFISDRRTKGHGPPTPPQRRGDRILPQPSQREGDYPIPILRQAKRLRRLPKWRKPKQYTRGKYGLKGQKQVSPRQRLGDCSQPTFAQNGQNNHYVHPTLCLSLMGALILLPPSGALPCYI